MNPDNQLLIGLAMISAALVFALIAIFALRKLSAQLGNESDSDGDNESMDEPTIPDPGEEALAAAPQLDSEAILDQLPSTPEQDPILTPTPPSESATVTRQRITVATLLRDEISGNLIVKVGNKEYQTYDELKESDDWTRVTYAASDLTKWLAGTVNLPELPELEVEDETTAKSVSMVEQINDILHEKLAKAEGEIKGLRLIEGPGGTLRVFIGVQSYSMDEVPDPEARRLISEAVAIWEDRQ